MVLGCAVVLLVATKISRKTLCTKFSLKDPKGQAIRESEAAQLTTEQQLELLGGKLDAMNGQLAAQGRQLDLLTGQVFSPEP